MPELTFLLVQLVLLPRLVISFRSRQLSFRPFPGTRHQLWRNGLGHPGRGLVKPVVVWDGSEALQIDSRRWNWECSIWTEGHVQFSTCQKEGGGGAYEMVALNLFTRLQVRM